MKVFFSILAIYMMTVFLMPCADMFKKETSDNNKHTEQLVNENNHDHSEPTDMCSPFCLCNCCGAVSGLVFHWNIINFSEIKAVELSKITPRYTSVFIPNYFGKIWQPPKINA